MKTTKKKPEVAYEHQDRLNQPIAVDAIVAFTYTGGKRVHIGRVTRLTAKRVRINYTYEYTGMTGITQQWRSDYQADPVNIIVLTGIEQQLTLLALRGVL